MSAEDDAKQDREKVASGSGWAWPLTWMVIVVVLVGAGVYVFKSCVGLPGAALDRGIRLADKIGQRAAEVAAAFNQGTITTTFTSYATSMSGSQYLQFATLSQQERFTRTDEASTAFGYVPLPDVIVEADAPVTYTYYLDLNEKWEFQVQNRTLTVIAPDIRFNKPAVDASRITYEVKKDSHFRRTSPAMEALKSSITSMTKLKAKTNVELVRETGRRQTELFVRNWLAKSFSDGTNYAVNVQFRIETRTNAPAFRRPNG